MGEQEQTVLEGQLKEEIIRKKRVAREEALTRLGWRGNPPPLMNGSKILLLAFPGGGFREAMESYVPHLAEVDDRYQIVMEKFWGASQFDQDNLHPEDFLAVADIRMSDFLAELTRITVVISQTAGALIAAAAQPAVISASVERAKDPKAGLQDRQMLFKATGFLPTPKGHTINIGGGAAAPQQGQVEEGGSRLMLGAGQAEEVGTKELPQFEGFSRKASKAMREQQAEMLEEGEFEEIKE